MANWPHDESWYNSSLFSVPVPGDIDAEVIRKFLEEANRETDLMPSITVPYQTTISVDAPSKAQFERLLKFLDLTEEERSFVRAALSSPEDADFFCVLADYLEEKGRSKASDKFRKLAKS